MGHRTIFQFSSTDAYRITTDRNIYLDTGEIRRRARTLRGTRLAAASYTSSLTMIELLAKIRSSNQEFGLRRAALRAIFGAEIAIDWQMVDQKVYCSFPTLRPKVDVFEGRVAALRSLATMAAGAADRAEFSRLVRDNCQEQLEYFEKYDEAIAAQYRDSAKALQQIGKSNYDPNSPFVAALGLPTSASHAEYVKAVQKSVLNRIITRGVFAYQACEYEGTDGKADRARFRHFFMEYDGSIDPYLLAFGWRHIEHAIGRSPGRNDGLDIAHLQFLFPGAILATTDHSLAKLAEAVGIAVYGSDVCAS